MLCGLVAALPWLGFGSGGFVVLGSTKHLPRFESWHGSLLLPLYLPLKLLYGPAEFVLHLSTVAGGDFVRVIYFPSEGAATVRPFVVFLFWGVLAAVFAVSALQAAFRHRGATGSTVDTAAKTGAEQHSAPADSALRRSGGDI